MVGLAAGLLADADVLISSANDPLLNIEYHRHFSHSLFFIPIGAAIAWMLGRKVTIDPETETFVGDDEANQMLSRPIREPWRV